MSISLKKFILFLWIALFPLFVWGEERLEDRMILSSPEEIASTISEESLSLGGIISPFSGQPILRETDLVIQGAQPLTLSRLYIPPSIPAFFPYHKKRQEEWDKFHLSKHLVSSYKGWVFLPHLRLEYFTNHRIARVTDINGITLDFRLSGSSLEKAELITPPYGLSNFAHENPSGKYDLRNTSVTHDKKSGTLTVGAPDGAIRYYGRGYHTHNNRSLFLLFKETLPNGKKILYHYNHKNELTSIESKDPTETLSYAKIDFQGALNLSGGILSFWLENNLSAKHSHHRPSLLAKLKKNSFTGAKVKNFEWDPILPSLLTKIESPFFKETTLAYDNRFLLTHYSGKDQTFALNYANFNGTLKVQALSLPVGKDGTPHPIYTFDYLSPKPGKSDGYTLVKNPDATFTKYHISENLLLTTIEWLDQNQILQKKKIYHFSDEHFLEAIEIQDGKGQTLLKKTFKCDSFGNPIEETLHANLTGESDEETYSIYRTFSQEGRNLLLKEVEEGGKTTEWEYLKETNLITKKLIKDQNHILQRTFRSYDSHHNLIQTIIDDGSGNEPNDLTDVISRNIKTYHLKKSPPFLHMVDCLEESIWEEGQEILLKKTHFVYDIYGNIKKEHVHGSDGNLSHIITKIYNERGNLLSETNPLEFTATYTYNSHGNLTSQTTFSGRKKTDFNYDQKQRPIHKKEIGENTSHHTSYSYDFLDRLIKKIDPFGNENTYTYDPLTHQVTHTTFPPIPSIDQNPTAVQTHTTYDPLGRPITQQDANGFSTHTTYNAHGFPLTITHPDQTTEHFRYTKKGDLATYTDQNKTTTHYTRDVLGRILTQTLTSPSAEEVATETFTYSGLHLLAATDKEGHLTTYNYDGAGRKIQQNRAGKITRFTYDPLGFLEAVIQENGENTLITRYKRDPLGQILEQTEEDTLGTPLRTVSYTYDADGNQTSTSREINGKISLTTYSYDPFGRIIALKDPLGHIWETQYDETHTNSIGQKVLQTLEQDPLKHTLIKTYDSHGKISEKKILSSDGQTVSKTSTFYDPAGNVTDRQDHRCFEGQLLDSTTIHFTYTPKGHLEETIEGYNTSYPRTTSYTYTKVGQIQTKTTPNDVVLKYTYNLLGHLQTLSSSSGDVFHTFNYNKLGQLLYAIDENTHVAIQRTLDPFGNILRETLSTGLFLEKNYDTLNRATSIYIPKVGVINYAYDPLFLRHVKREGKYTHTYSHYDQSGNPLQEELIYNLGSMYHSYDLKGKEQKLFSPYLSLSAHYDPLGNLIHTTLDSNAHKYSYDPLSRLIQEDTDTYKYDSLHNPIEKNGKSTEIGPHHTLLADRKNTYTYDLNGNRTSQNSNQKLSYDSLNRLTHVSSKNTQMTYTYDPLGRRLSKTIKAEGYLYPFETKEYYLYDGENEIGSFSEQESPLSLKIPGRQDRPIAIEINGYPYAPILDIHGNVHKLIDPYKQIQATYHYSAFGEKISSASIENPYRYKGKRHDGETGFVYFGKRYYDPNTHRFLTTDPLGFVNSTNLYQYVFNNPFRYIDPDGQFVMFIQISP